jgi:tetratricopeptide (TPR) repeat protein
MAGTILVVCLLLLFSSVRSGLARLYYLSNDEGIPSNDKAIRLAPHDPAAHYFRALVLAESDRFSEATADYERAVALRPRDHYLWLELGYARVQTGDDNGASIAYQNAVRLAPYYAQPHSRLGEFLLRTGQRERAFTEFRSATASDPALLPSLMDLAWKEYGGNAEAVERAVRPQSAAARLDLARFLLEKGNTPAAMNIFRGTRGINDPERRRLIDDLLKAKNFVEAYDVWLSGRGERSENSANGRPEITDGGFEKDIDLDEIGFGWKVAGNRREPRVTLDVNDPYTGASSLRIDFNGESEPAVELVSQLVIVEPSTRYRLSFAARTLDLQAGGLPLIRIRDAGGPKVMGESQALPAGSNGWQNYTVEFLTNGASRAVYVSLQRRNCITSLCPIFGHMWLDSFELQKV